MNGNANRIQAEGVIKNIIREIVQECASRGEGVSETLVAFIVKAVVLEPQNDFQVDRVLASDDVQRLIDLCVKRLLNNKSIALDTVKMQVYFDMNYTTRDEFLTEHRRVLETRLQPISREITDNRATTKDELEALYRKIVSSVLLRSGLGSPTDISVVREATAALQSVFPQTELGNFLNLSKRDKDRQLIELTQIVTGIRLFNKECGKGGEGIDNLPTILNEAIPATLKEIQQQTDDAVDSSEKFIAVLDTMTTLSQKQLGSDATKQKIQEAMINSRQFELYLNTLSNDARQSAREVDELLSQFKTRLDQLKTTIQNRTAVPTAQVYPQFMHLAVIWFGFQDEMVLLSVLSNILYSLEPYTLNTKDLLSDESVRKYLSKVSIITDQQRLQVNNTGNVVQPEERNAEGTWYYSETTKNFDKLPLMYKGFCAYHLALNDFKLIHGDPRIGIVQINDHFYSFSEPKDAILFCRKPATYIESIANNAKLNAELIQLLDLHTHFSNVAPYGDLTQSSSKPHLKADCGSQTDTHFHEKNIVKDYEWNEWELRRKAIKLANLRRRLTKSIQTNTSNFRRENTTQVYLPKDQYIQTKRDNYTNVPQPKVYLSGIRGHQRHDDGHFLPANVQKIDLTRDIDE
ncbi:unnamed protein product [Adineta steineri]|uniref:Cilia- and flagella-associated protein 206 n=1 Tax=Adineta steineri TaxID=433720 RepID=A0A814L1Q1_9BILA|nr:unnamed protein product [Adineta steineri]CAF3757267.1 unnamed protein product [Adineta steineri]